MTKNFVKFNMLILIVEIDEHLLTVDYAPIKCPTPVNDNGFQIKLPYSSLLGIFLISVGVYAISQ